MMRRGPRRVATLAVFVFAFVTTGLLPWFATAASNADAGLDAAALETGGATDARSFDSEGDEAIRRLRERAAHVRALLDETLDPAIAPQSLFDVALDDPEAIDLEAARLRTLLRYVQGDVTDAALAQKRRDAGDAEAGAATIAPALWRARVDLDRARLAFYDQPTSKRLAILANDADRKAAAATVLSEAEQRAKAAEEQRQRALQAAREARSEGERLVSEEYARLLDVERQQVAFATALARRREAVGARREATLVWQRRAREARLPRANTADAIYNDLRRALRSARDDLDAALERSKDTSEVPQAGPDPLSELHAAISTRLALEQRARVDATALRLSIEEQAVREEQAAQLLDEIDALNTERLALLPFLSASQRSSITGFTSVGADQAASELRHLTLIARYHRYAASRWFLAFRSGKHGLGVSVGGAILLTLELGVAVVVFLWARRRTPQALRALRQRWTEDDRRERLTKPSVATRAAAFAEKIHRPIEGLSFALLLSWLLPAAARGLLEVQLVTVVVEWVFGGALVVVVVNALADAEIDALAGDIGAPELRLRSLRLVGRVVVGFGLVLVLTSRLVGAGTIYHWVISTCWLTALPLLLVLVRWWRDVVFERVDRTRKKTRFERWILENRGGWKSFIAATGGALYLFGRGVYRAARNWISRFDITRSVLAYFFRRELGKLEAERSDLVTARIPDEAFDALGPSVLHEERVPIDVDDDLERLTTRLKDRRGGVVAIVGARGMGKSFVLHRLHAAFEDSLFVKASSEGEAVLRATLGETLVLGASPSFDQAANAIAASSKSRAFFLDDAHHFVQPFMGGLATFDALLAAAAKSSEHTTWVFAIDEILWVFLQRARAGRPLFDDVIRLYPWREEQIIELLRARTTSAGLEPSFERLLEKLPGNADAIDKQEALERRAVSYYRLLWDYAAGNPGIALHMWRRSLGADADGGTHVRFFQAPDATDLERLPDQTLLVLRAILQLAPATPEGIARATMLSAADIADALRYSVSRTYITETDGRYTVTWTWLRAISLFLQRRHLLVAT